MNAFSSTSQHKPGFWWWKRKRFARALSYHPADPCYICQTSLSWSASYLGTTKLSHLINSNRHHNGILVLFTSKQYQTYLKVGNNTTSWKVSALFSSGLAMIVRSTLPAQRSDPCCYYLTTLRLDHTHWYKPSLSHYSSIWDIGVVLQYLKTLGPAFELDLKTLTTKKTMLLCLLTGLHCPTLTKLDANFMQILPNKIVFTAEEKLKTTMPGKHLQPIIVALYDHDKTLCIVSHLQTYQATTLPFCHQTLSC